MANVRGPAWPDGGGLHIINVQPHLGEILRHSVYVQQVDPSLRTDGLHRPSTTQMNDRKLVRWLRREPLRHVPNSGHEVQELLVGLTGSVQALVVLFEIRRGHHPIIIKERESVDKRGIHRGDSLIAPLDLGVLLCSVGIAQVLHVNGSSCPKTGLNSLVGPHHDVTAACRQSSPHRGAELLVVQQTGLVGVKMPEKPRDISWVQPDPHLNEHVLK
mmetsp:Transcript_31609/g.69248  ORF Transcript_31609/g.69248 Transcript_31609/m.69248 type:complete len:216 (+) Transcript_31609:226-873(+)